MLLSLYPAIVGLIGGIISSAAMTLTEIPLWKESYFGVFEWHQNLVTFGSLAKCEKKGRKSLGLFHFPNGALAGIAFSHIISFLIHSTSAFCYRKYLLSCK
jgi:hypothetical protein